MKIRLSAVAALAALAAAGVLAALTLAPAAFAWSPSNLPPGFSTSHIIDTAPGSTCPEAYSIFGPGGSGSGPLCTSSPTYQQDFDAFVDSHYTPPPSTTTTTAAGTTTDQATTTGATTTDPATTTTTTTTTDPGTTTTPPVTTEPASTTTTQALTPAEQTLSERLDALTAQIAALTSRVTRVEKAGDVAWLAYQQAVAQGADARAAADIARGTWLNVVNGLGDFA